MIVVDTNIISTFARVSALEHVKTLLEVECLFINPAAFGELHRAREAGCDFIENILELIRERTFLDIVELTRAEILATQELPRSLGAGEAESIAVCLMRKGTKLLTNDKSARNFCREKSIPCLDLPAILRALWLRQVLAKQEVRNLLQQIEAEEGIVIKNSDRIFE